MTTTHESPADPSGAAPSPWAGLLDDTSACTTGALAAYDAAAAPHVGALVVPDTLLPAALSAGTGRPLAVRLTGGAGQVAGPAALCARAGVVPARLEVALRDPVGLAESARRVVAAVDAARVAGGLAEETVVAVGLTAGAEAVGEPGHGWLAAADEAAAAELALALPTAGAALPVVAGWVDAALDRELAVVATGPHTAAEAVGLLVLVRLVLDGEPLDEAASVAADPARARAASTELGEAALHRARRWLLGVGCDDPAGAVLPG